MRRSSPEILTSEGPRAWSSSGRPSLISPRGFTASMSHLIDAIQAETRGDFATAAGPSLHLTESGLPLDRIGVFQALARCHEKLGHLNEAGAWRRKAGKA